MPKSRKQKLWKQKGCSHKSCGKCYMCKNGGDPPIAPFAIKGGMCGTCMNENCSCAGPSEMNGGSNGIFNGAIPGPIVGNHWQPNPANWPGANGLGGSSNILPYNTYAPVDISRQMEIRGGKRKRSSKRYGKKSKKRRSNKKFRGGSPLMPQDLLNLGRDFAFNMEGAYKALNGMPAPVNPLPYKDQLLQATKY
jgi:hypothetical protein